MMHPRLIAGARLQYDDVRELLDAMGERGLVIDAAA
jgi:hypothetical protein